MQPGCFQLESGARACGASRAVGRFRTPMLDQVHICTPLLECAVVVLCAWHCAPRIHAFRHGNSHGWFQSMKISSYHTRKYWMRLAQNAVSQTILNKRASRLAFLSSGCFGCCPWLSLYILLQTTRHRSFARVLHSYARVAWSNVSTRACLPVRVCVCARVRARAACLSHLGDLVTFGGRDLV